MVKIVIIRCVKASAPPNLVADTILSVDQIHASVTKLREMVRANAQVNIL